MHYQQYQLEATLIISQKSMHHEPIYSGKGVNGIYGTRHTDIMMQVQLSKG